MRNSKSLQNLKPIQPGEVRNPKGRGSTPNRSTVVKKWLSLEEKTTNPITGLTEYLSQEDLITLAIIKKAREGDTQAYTKLLDSLYGTCKSSVDISATDVERVVHIVVTKPEDKISDPIE